MSSPEASEVVDEILTDLLTQVCSPQPPPPPAPTVPPEDVGGPHFDLCYMSREVCDLLNCFSLRPAGVHIEVCQVKCLEQQASGECHSHSRAWSYLLFFRGWIMPY